LIGCQPRIDEPSRPNPSSNESSLSCWIVTVVCCQMPGRSMNFRSTNLAPCFSAYLRTSLGVMRRSFGSGVSDRVLAPLAGADADHLVDRQHEDLAVADAAGLGGERDGLDHLVHEIVLDDDLELDLR